MLVINAKYWWVATMANYFEQAKKTFTTTIKSNYIIALG